MISKKKIATIIQIILMISVVTVIFVTLKTVQFDNNKNIANVPVISADPVSGCPSRVIRKCCSRTYCSEVKECPVAINECDLQKDIKTCFQYEWKDSSSPGLCKNCDMLNSDSITLKKLKTCK